MNTKWFCCSNHDSFNVCHSIESHILHSIASNMYRSNPFDWVHVFTWANVLWLWLSSPMLFIDTQLKYGFQHSQFTVNNATDSIGTWCFSPKTSRNCVMHKLIRCKCLLGPIFSHGLNSSYRILTKSFAMKRINRAGHSVTLHLTNFRCSVLILDQITYSQI